MKKEQKKQFVKDFKDILNNVGILVVTHYSGLKTTQTDELRLKIKEAGGKFLIVKNSLMKIILKDNKNKEFKSLFNGPVALAYSEDEVSAAKVAVNFSKDNDKLLILGGLSNDKFLEKQDVLEIALLPVPIILFIKSFSGFLVKYSIIFIQGISLSKFLKTSFKKIMWVMAFEVTR